MMKPIHLHDHFIGGPTLKYNNLPPPNNRKIPPSREVKVELKLKPARIAESKNTLSKTSDLAPLWISP